MKLKTIFITAALFVIGIVFFGFADTTLAAGPLDAACASNPNNELCKSSASGQTIESVMGVVVNALLYIVGAISVIMIIASGIMYTISSGDSGRVAKAKNMLIYAVVGLVVAFVAFALTNWVFRLF